MRSADGSADRANRRFHSVKYGTGNDRGPKRIAAGTNPGREWVRDAEPAPSDYLQVLQARPKPLKLPPNDGA